MQLTSLTPRMIVLVGGMDFVVELIVICSGMIDVAFDNLAESTSAMMGDGFLRCNSLGSHVEA